MNNFKWILSFIIFSMIILFSCLETERDVIISWEPPSYFFDQACLKPGSKIPEEIKDKMSYEIHYSINDGITETTIVNEINELDLGKMKNNTKIEMIIVPILPNGVRGCPTDPKTIYVGEIK